MAATGDGVRKSTGREYFEALLIAVIFVNFLRVFIFEAFKIPSESMEDNLLAGDHIIVNKFIYGLNENGLLSKLLPIRDVRRGDVVVFRYPRDPQTDFVKRVVALPGEQVAVRDRQVFIDGRPLDEPYAVFESRVRGYRDWMEPRIVPDGHFFAMGDNRDHSHDSRAWGFVPRANLKGRAFMVYWSFDGAPPPTGSPMQARLDHLLDVMTRFFSGTRWSRTFLIIDRTYHATTPGNRNYEND